MPITMRYTPKANLINLGQTKISRPAKMDKIPEVIAIEIPKNAI